MKNMNLLQVIEEYDLAEYYIILLTKNVSNYKPYHNLKHTVNMTMFCHKIMSKEFKELTYTEEGRALLLAALFHDFGHMSTNDSENIRTAIGNFKRYSTENDRINAFVTRLIETTEYPYVVSIPDDATDLSKCQQIIRDADLLQFTKKEFIEHVVLGLSKELDVPLDKLIIGQRAFMKGITYHTKTAKKIAKKVMKERYAELDMMEKFLWAHELMEKK